MWHDAGLRRRHGYEVPGFAFSFLFSLLRIVDDGAFVSTGFCKACVIRLLQICWGEEMTITIEEEATREKPYIRFGDSIERRVGNMFYLYPFFLDSPVGPELAPSRVRFLPAIYQPHPIAYTRSLALNVLHRTAQLKGHDHQQIYRALLELFWQLHHPQNGYRWSTLRRAVRGSRQSWAVPVATSVRIAFMWLQVEDDET